MKEYYGVNPSSDFFAHYGIKGMKWGIRKAVDKAYSGRSHSLSFSRARDKLRKIQQEHEINRVQNAQLHGRTRKVRRLYNKASERLEQLDKNANRNYQRGQNDQMKEDQSRLFWWSDSAGNLGSGPTKNTAVRIMNRIDGRKSRKLITDKGHAKAVHERNAYAAQMNKMFKGTAYAKQANALSKKRIRVQK